MSEAMEPNWKPLETRLGPERCAGFMFMGRTDGINHYKHGISRQYLFLDDDGQAYEATGNETYRRIPFGEALSRVEAPLKELGESLKTPYDFAYMRRKDAALRAAGLEVLRIQITAENSRG